MPHTPLLDKIKNPQDLKKLQISELKTLADELRLELIDAVSVTGGHLGAGLGVVELTIALHYLFDTPKDRLVWDVGHQAYPHKILTERRDRIRTLRKGGGLSGFTKRSESIYDPFGAAHSSTSISASLGMAVARDLDDRNNNVIAVIGDGAMSAGMAYEAMKMENHRPVQGVELQSFGQYWTASFQIQWFGLERARYMDPKGRAIKLNNNPLYCSIIF